MAEFEIKIKILSPIHLGSGQADINVDSEIIHDNFGLPYFPAKRFKGLLYESAVEVCEMFELAEFEKEKLPDLNKIFHKKSSESGTVDDVQIIVPNFYIYPFEEYKKICDEWKYLQINYPEILRPADVLNTFTAIRYQTKLENGIAADGSLHNMRVLNSGIEFFGKIILLNGNEKILTLLALAIRNLSSAGTKRNRGFGKIECTINFDDGKNEDFYIKKFFNSKGA